MCVSATCFVSCTEPGPDTPTDRNVHPALWVSPAAADNHGVNVVSGGSKACIACHGLTLEGSGFIPSCVACHFDAMGGRIPSGSSWTHGTRPHGQFKSERSVCNNCHDLYRKAGLPPAACHDCHAGNGTASHPFGQAWLDKKSPTNHGITAKKNPAECTACHGADYNGGTAGVSCYSCHFSPAGSLVPPGSSWSHGSVPHSSLSSYGVVCNNCHNTDRTYGNAPASCHDCHATGAAPHPTGQTWLDRKSATFHGVPAKQNVAQCAACHGSDYNGGSSGVSCNKCHFGPSGTMVPQGQSWTHGTVPHSSLSSYGTVCNQCHGLDRSYGIGPASCHDCHGSVASHQTGQVWLDRKSAAFHGIPAKQNVLQCAACHGSDYRGGTAGVSCYTCHFGPSGTKVPAGRIWVHGTIPHDSLSSFVTVCNKCHGLDRTYGNGPSSCHDCHGDGD